MVEEKKGPSTKVLLVCAAFPPHGKGGGPAASQAIARSLAEHNDVVVVTVSDTYEQWQDGKITVKSIGSPNIYWNYWKTHSAPAKIVWHILENFNPRAFWRISKEIRRERPDILATVSVENVNVTTWLAARLHGIPTVHFIQSYFLVCWRGSMFRQRKNCNGQCLSCKLVTIGRKRLSARVDLVAAEADSTLKIHFDNGYFEHTASFVAPGMLAATSTSPRTNRRTDGPLRVGYIGLLTYNKGVHLIASAARKLSSPDLIDVTIAGDGEPAYRDELTAEFRGIPTSFEGWVKPADFYGKIDILVVPSLWREPFGRVCIEAFAAGVPVLASDIGGLATIVKDNRNGFLFSPGDTDHLAKIMNSLIQNRDQLQLLRANCLMDAALYRPDRIGAIIQEQFRLLRARKKLADAGRLDAHIG
jgi:glycosyltransferase involved in cell wall biosynthesis